MTVLCFLVVAAVVGRQVVLRGATLRDASRRVRARNRAQQAGYAEGERWGHGAPALRQHSSQASDNSGPQALDRQHGSVERETPTQEVWVIESTVGSLDPSSLVHSSTLYNFVFKRTDLRKYRNTETIQVSQCSVGVESWITSSYLILTFIFIV